MVRCTASKEKVSKSHQQHKGHEFDSQGYIYKYLNVIVAKATKLNDTSLFYGQTHHHMTSIIESC